MKLRVAGLIPESIVDGPGIRLALFVQGCSHGCPGCHNPEAQDPRGGVEMTVDQLRERIRSSRGIDGVTFSGGEPFEQPAPMAQLAETIRGMGLNLVLYSGYTFEELLLAGDGDESVRRLLQAGWLLVDGPFIMAQRDLTLPYRGSRNQRILHLPRSLRERKPVPWEAG